MKRTATSLAAIAAALVQVGGAAAAGYPNDYFYVQGDQWGLAGAAASINAPGAWPVATGYGVLVADVDTGADFGHPDLQGKLVPGAQFLACPGLGTGPGSDPPSGTGQAAVQDDVGHGSMTTGLMVADTNNGQGIAAVAPDARALVVKVLSRTIQTDSNGTTYATGSGCDNDVAAGIEWAVDHGAQVVNLSIGSDIPLTGAAGDITSAVDYAWRHNVAVALAAGNNRLKVSDYSTVSSEALVVGALAPDGSIARYSTNGTGVNLYAPGGDAQQGTDLHHLVLSTNWPDPQFGTGQYEAEQGTSFAAPHAAGVLALLRSCGLSGQAAVNRVKSIAAGHGQHLDAAATLAGLSGCATPPGGHPPAPSGGGGGTTSTGGHTGTAPSGGQAAASATARPGQPTASPGAASPSAGVASGAEGASSSRDPGHAIALHPLPTSPPGGPPTGLIAAGLGAVVVAGAPLAVRARRRLRA